MEFEIKIKGIEHDDLVALFSDATYGNPNFDITIPKSELLYTNPSDDDCREDKWAKVLMNGGSIRIWDILSLEDEYEKEDPSFKPEGGHFQSAELRKYKWSDFLGDHEGWCATYLVSLQDILDGMGEEDAQEHVRNLANGDDDGITGDAILQCVCFGEIVYG